MSCRLDDFTTLRNEKPEYTINDRSDRTKFIALWRLYNELKTNRLWQREAERDAPAEHQDAEMLTLLVEHLNPVADAGAAAAVGADVMTSVQRGIVMMNWRTYSVSIEDKINKMNDVVKHMSLKEQIAYFQLDNREDGKGFFHAMDEIYKKMTGTDDPAVAAMAEDNALRTAKEIFADIVQNNTPKRNEVLNEIIRRCSLQYERINDATGGAAEAGPVSNFTAAWAVAIGCIASGILNRNVASIIGGLSLFFRLGATEEGKKSLETFNQFLITLRSDYQGANQEPLFDMLDRLVRTQTSITAATAARTTQAVAEAALRETTVSRETLGHITHLAVSASKAAAVNAGRVTVRCAIFPMIHLVMSVGLLFANPVEADNGEVADAMREEEENRTPTSPKIVKVLRNIITLMSERHLTMSDLNITDFERETSSQPLDGSVPNLGKLHDIGIMAPRLPRRQGQPVPELPDIPTRVRCYLMMVLGRDPDLITFPTFCDHAGGAAGGIFFVEDVRAHYVLGPPGAVRESAHGAAFVPRRAVIRRNHAVT